MTKQPRISIVGAGIAGLSLACRLARIGIPFTIYEARKEQNIGHNYAITLTKKWRKHVRDFDEKRSQRIDVFRQDTACDRLIGGQGKVLDDSKIDSVTFQAIDKDVRNFLVKRLIQRNIQVNWDHKLVEVREAVDGNGALLKFDNDHEVVADIIVDSGGLGASSFGQNISQPAPPKLLPYATYYGTRRISFKEFEERFATYFGSGNYVKLFPSQEQPESTLISVQKIHIQKGSTTPEDHTVELRWVFSRPPQGDSDPLYRPKRAKEEAKTMPPEFPQAILDLVRNNQYSKKMKKFVSELFKLSEIENDRVLNWHLRLQLPPREYFSLNESRASCRVFAIGDAAHALPILESRGAMVAMDDAKELAQVLKQICHESHPDKEVYNETEIYDRWVYEAREAVQRLRKVHGEKMLTTDELDALVGKLMQPISSKMEDSGNEASDVSEDDTTGQHSSKI